MEILLTKREIEGAVMKEKVSDEQLMLLEQLTYLDEKVVVAAGLDKNDYDVPKGSTNITVSKYLSSFTEEALMKLQNSGETIGYIQGYEWAAIIRALKEDPKISRLTISDYFIDSRGNRAAICFTDQSGVDQPIVAFRGTIDGPEWYDNVAGLNMTDTPSQREALYYIESLPYQDITVVGHSKGGNKAKYVTFLSDKPTRCLAMDAQGFSPEFTQKYRAEILKKEKCIKNYSLDADFVNPLMYRLKGTKWQFFEGHGVEGLAENHSSNSIFKTIYDEKGRAVIAREENGYLLTETDGRTPTMEYVHDFVNFVLNVMPNEKKNIVKHYVGNILRIGIEGDKVKEKGKTYTKENLLQYILSDTDALSIIIAYLVKYVEVYDLSKDEIKDILKIVGVDEKQIEIFENKIPMIIGGKTIEVSPEDTIGQIASILKVLATVSPNKMNLEIYILLGMLSASLEVKYNIDINLSWLLLKVKIEYSLLMFGIDKHTANQERDLRAGARRDFSKEMYEKLIEKIGDFERKRYDDLSAWTKYSGEEWYSKLDVSAIKKKHINYYTDRLSEMNSSNKEKIRQVFENEWAIDNAGAKKINELILELDKATIGYRELAERVAP